MNTLLAIGVLAYGSVAIVTPAVVESYLKWRKDHSQDYYDLLDQNVEKWSERAFFTRR